MLEFLVLCRWGNKGELKMKNICKLLILFLALSVFSVVADAKVEVFGQPIDFKKINEPPVTSVNASHILVKTQSQAIELKSRIDKGESFEELAKKYSECPSKANGGNLGYFERGQMVPEFERAAFKLPVGEVSEPVQTQFGWHLIKVVDKK